MSHSSLSDEAWCQASLPISLGGLGLREAQSVSPLAFIGSCNSSRDLVKRLLSTSATNYKESSVLLLDCETSSKAAFLQEFGSLTSDTNIDSISQRLLQKQEDTRKFDSLKQSSTIRDQARLNAISEPQPHAGAWLTAIPNSNLGLAMSRHEFTVALRLRLGISLFPSHPNAVRCPCGQLIDKFSDHLLGCRKNSLRSKRHDALRDTIYNALLIDDKGTLLEQRFSSQNNNRPGDVYHPNFLFGRPAYFDLTIRNTVQLKFVANSENYAVQLQQQVGKLEKDLKYEEAVADSGALFFPLAVETYDC